MRLLSLTLASATLLSCATTGAVTPAAPAQPISGTVTAGGKPVARAQVAVVKHRPALGAEPPCACEDHPTHPLGACGAPESTEKLMSLARSDPSTAPVATVTTAEDGTFSTPPIAEGSYDVIAQVKGALGWKDSVLPGASAAIALRPTGTVSGQVVGAGSKPISGAEVVVTSTELRDVHGVVSNESGAFEAAGVPMGSVTVAASQPGHTPIKGQPSIGATIEGAAAFAPVGIHLPPRVTLRGKVTRAGAPVAGAQVTAQSDCRTYQTRTDAAGAFELAGLPAREYPVSAVSGWDGAQALASMDAPGPLSLELRRGGVLAGTVKDAKGPLAGAEIVAVPRQPRGAGEIRRTRANKDGKFEMGPMPPGKWQVEVAASGHLSRPPAELRISEGARQPLDVELAPATVISGYILNDTADGLANAEVEAVRSDAPSPDCTGCRVATRTARDGAFDLYPLALGEYTVRATHDQFLPGQVKLVKPTAEFRLVLQSGASLFGTVHDPDQPAAVSATASVRSGDQVVRPPRPVDPNGTFRLEGLQDGTHTVVVESGDPFPRRAETSVTVEQKSAPGVDVTLPPGAPLAGRVLDDAGKPIAGAAVHVAAEGGQAMAVVQSGADGAFELPRAPRGKYRLSASREGFLPGPKSAAAAEAGSRKISLTLSRLPSVTGRVRAPAGAQVPAVWVNGQRQAVDAQRRFRAPLQRPGKQVILVEAAGMAPAAASVDAQAGRDADAGEIALSPGRAVEGQVLDPDGKPVAKAQVLAAAPSTRDALRQRLYWSPEESPSPAPELTDASGRFRVERAPEGDAVLLVRHPLYQLAEAPLPAGQAAASVQLRGGGTVVGKAVDAGGDPVRGVVTLVPADGRALVLSGTVSDAGRFGFGGLPEGRYTVAVNALPSADGSLLVFDPATAEVRGREAAQVELRARQAGARVKVELRLPEALGALSARLLPADALEAPAQSLYRRLFLAMPAEAALARTPTFRHAPAGPQTLVLMRDLGRGVIGLDRRRIDVPASGELSLAVGAVQLETVLREEE